MKKTLFLSLIFALILSGCAKNPDSGKNGNGLASIRVTLQGQKSGNDTRLVGPSNPNPALEDVISNFTVFVFTYDTGDLERMETFDATGGNYTGQITDLSTGTAKRIVAYVNVPTTMNLQSINSYAALSQNILTLDSQYAANINTIGLFMSGEAADRVVLQPSQQNTVTVNVKRRVAKIVLRSLQVDPDEASNIAEFTLGGVSIQKARVSSTPIGALVNPTGDLTTQYAGGIASPAGAVPNYTLTETYLSEPIALETVPDGEIIGTTAQQRYFYVLPNDNTNDNATLMTIFGTYGATPVAAYYPFLINGSVGTGDNPTDGNYIESNKIYTLTVTLNRINLPSEDPNIIPAEAALDVTILPEDWELTINQVVQW